MEHDHSRSTATTTDDNCTEDVRVKSETAPSRTSNTTAVDFYDGHGVSVSADKWQQPYRFVRMNPRYPKKETLEKLKAEVSQDPYPVPVPWLDGFFALPATFSLHQSELYQSAHIYGQDASSGAAVAALFSEIDDDNNNNNLSNGTPLRILDMCCCPGLKLCGIADALRSSISCTTSSTLDQHVVVGVDVSEQRLQVCKKILNKYQVRANDPVRLRLYCNDGRTFGNVSEKQPNLVFDSEAAIEEDRTRIGTKRKRMNKSARAREQRRLSLLTKLDLSFVDERKGIKVASMKEFDLVLVDAECSTDGSLVHIQKRLEKAEKEITRQTICDTLPKLTNSDQLGDLVALQQNLIMSGFQLLCKGGHMVYSTCSLCEAQNEGVVRWLLRKFPDSEIAPLRLPGQGKCPDLVKEGTLQGTIRFLPNTDSIKYPIDCNRLYGGGFFLAKIKRTM